jgi:hypothetical protein
MSVIQSLQNLSSLSRISRQTETAQGLKPYLAIEPAANTDFRRARTYLLNLYRSLEELAALADVETRFKLDLPAARSSHGLGLDLTQTAAALASTDEINASPMSFTPFGPDWAGASDALITIGGEYLGTDGTDTLTFESRRNGTHGSNNLIIRVEDSLGNPVRTINIGRNEPLDQQYDLGNGLYMTLGTGSLINRDTTTIQVFDNIGAAVDPSKPFDGIRNDNPNLEFGIASIVDGSFLLNGEGISVTTTDSIDDVIDRINLSNAGVSATFNAVSERIEFLHDTPGSVPTIEIQGDTSNFLQATKLDSAFATPGSDAESDKVFDDVAEFSALQTGNIIINGQHIAIDTATDSLVTVIDKINASPARVVASFDTQTQRVLIEAQPAAGGLELDSNGTDFFGTLNIPEGRVNPDAGSQGFSRRRSYGIADAAASAFGNINKLFRDASFLERGANASRFRAPLEAAIRSAYGGELSGEFFGLQVDGSSDARLRGDFLNVNRQDLTKNLQLRGDAVRDLLAARDGSGGLVQGLLNATRQALTNVNQALGISGTFVDTFA